MEVLKKNPEHYDALFNLASIYLKTSAFSEAYPLLQKLMNHDPENPQILVNMAVAEIGLGRPNKAISYLDRADRLKDAPRFEIYFHRGVALSHLKKLDEAMTCYKKAEELHPNDHRLLFNMAVACDKLERYDGALTYYERFLRRGGPSSPDERKEVEARIRVLKLYMARNQKSP
jgi:tetratricopeptide (TPR) repeat protein